MNKNDIQLLIGFFEFALETATIETESTKIFFHWLETIEVRMSAYRALAGTPYRGSAIQAAIKQLEAVENHITSEIATKKPAILDALAKVESYHERLEHRLAVLKASVEG